MAVNDFYNINQNIAYPLTPSPSLYQGGAGIVDAGFILGPSVDFNYELTPIRLNRIEKAGNTLTFVFSSTATNFQDVIFTRHMYVPFGTTTFVDITDGDQLIVSAFLVTGDLLTVFSDMADGVFNSNVAVEPSTIQHICHAEKVIIANDARNTTWEGTALEAELDGDIEFTQGYNCVFREDENGIIIGARPGYGEGTPNENFVVDEDGVDTEEIEAVDEYIYSINGVNERNFIISSSFGVSIVAGEDPNTLVIRVPSQRIC